MSSECFYVRLTNVKYRLNLFAAYFHEIPYGGHASEGNPVAHCWNSLPLTIQDGGCANL